MKQQASPFCLDSCCFHLGDLLGGQVRASSPQNSFSAKSSRLKVSSIVAPPLRFAFAWLLPGWPIVITVLFACCRPWFFHFCLFMALSCVRSVPGSPRLRVLPHVGWCDRDVSPVVSCWLKYAPVAQHSWHTCTILNN